MSRTTAFILDVIAIAVFAFLARVAHQTDEMPLNVTGWLNTMWPFLLGVLVAWGIFMAAKWTGISVSPAGVTVWVVTVVVGLGIWSLRNAAIPHWSFILVATVMSGLLLVGWRAVAAFTARRRT